MTNSKQPAPKKRNLAEGKKKQTKTLEKRAAPAAFLKGVTTVLEANEMRMRDLDGKDSLSLNDSDLKIKDLKIKDLKIKDLKIKDSF